MGGTSGSERLKLDHVVPAVSYNLTRSLWHYMCF